MEKVLIPVFDEEGRHVDDVDEAVPIVPSMSRELRRLALKYLFDEVRKATC